MATDILNIPQIDPSKIESLQNDLHMGLGGSIARQLQKVRWTDDTHATKVFPEAVDALMGAFVLAQGDEDQVYKKTAGSDLTKKRLEKDQERDVLFKEIKKTVDTFATLTILPAKQQAALKMQPVMQKYDIQPDGGIEAQSVATEQWLQEQERSYQLELAAKELGIHESILQLKTLNEEIQQLTDDRNHERSAQVNAELRTARTQTDQALRALVLMLNAQAVTQEDNALYVELIQQFQETIKYYRQLSDERRRANRRVAVKSDIVGNHAYATVVGWTWQRLVDEGKAALAVADDGARVVSTDKKALKAGGLCVALDGQPVKPTDEVDASREYELIPIG